MVLGSRHHQIGGQDHLRPRSLLGAGDHIDDERIAFASVLRSTDGHAGLALERLR